MLHAMWPMQQPLLQREPGNDITTSYDITATGVRAVGYGPDILRCLDWQRRSIFSQRFVLNTFLRLGQGMHIIKILVSRVPLLLEQ